MATKTIISVGLEIPGDIIQEIAFYSDRSLLDADIVIFSPIIRGYSTELPGTYMGLPSLDDYWSVRTRNAFSYWRSEIKTAFDAGKTVFIMLPEYQEMYAQTGTTERSGTGRSMKTITHVTKNK